MAVESSRRQLEYLGVAAAVFDVAMFAFTGYFVFENLLWGTVTGILVGVGTYLFLPELVALGQDDGTAESGDPSATATGGTRLGPDRTAAGIALAAAGIAVMAAGFAAPDDLALALLVGALVGAVAYLPLAWLLRRA